MQDWLITYFPHPFFWASAMLAGFGYWTFISERRRVKTPHPMTRRPLKLALSSVLFGIAVFAAMSAASYYFNGAPNQADLAIFAIFGFAGGCSYFICPYLGYNFFSNTRVFSGTAPFFMIALMLLFACMGMQAQFGW